MSLDVLDPATVLAAAETSVRTRRAAALEDLDLVLAWADLHGDDPRRKPGAIPVRSRAASTSRANPSSSICRGETLTKTLPAH